MKICIACKQELPLEAFPPNAKNKDGLNRKCRVCFNKYQREWYQNNKELHKSRVMASRNPAMMRARKYGLTPTDVNAMLALYNGKCYLCKERPASCIDHDHATGRVRGVLCNGCNTGLGKLGDTIAGLERAIEYLRG